MKSKLLIFVLIGVNVLLGGGVGAVHYLINMDMIPQVETRIKEVKKSCEELQRTINEKPTILAGIKKLEETKAALMSRIPGLQRTWDNFLDQLQLLADDSQVVLDPKPDFILSRGPVNPNQPQQQLPKSIIKVQLQITSYGRFFNLVDFIYRLEHMDRIKKPDWQGRYVKVYYYALEKQKDSDQLKLVVKINTYSFDKGVAPITTPSNTSGTTTKPDKSTGVPD